MQTVHLRITDGRTGKPTPVRISVRDLQGHSFAPLGRMTEFSTASGEDLGGHVWHEGRPWYYIDGTCEIRLPIGSLELDARKGPEYLPLKKTIHLAAGQLSLRESISPWISDTNPGWYSGDLRVHDMSPHAALLEGAGENLDMVQILCRTSAGRQGKTSRISNMLAFSGTEACLSNCHCQVVVNTMNQHHFLGTVGLLDCHRPVFPLDFGGEGGYEDWSVVDWCDQCHRKRGVVTWPDLPRLSQDHPQGEALAAAILGKMDVFEITQLSGFDDEKIARYYDLLNCGIRMGLGGASGKESNQTLMGSHRTYAYLEGELTPERWAQSVRAGKTLIGNGPHLRFEVGEKGPGSNLVLERGGRITARAMASLPGLMDRVEILEKGKVVATGRACEEDGTASVEVELECQSGTWLAARCLEKRPRPNEALLFAHSSPVWIEVPSRPLLAGPEASRRFIQLLDQTQTWVLQKARCEREKDREHLLNHLREASTHLEK
ncbi:MAG: CehA/McbA family metallohydrolase [Gemmataceae bacterium]